MKPIHLAVLIFSLLLLNFVNLTTARSINFPRSTWLANILYPRANDGNPKPDTFICTTTNSSPFQNHVQFGAEEMRKAQGNHWCTQESRDGCMELINYGTAFVTMCGEYRTKLRCYHLVDALNDLVRACTKDTGTIGGKLRISGRAVFDWGYLEVTNK
ncbi:uncharacterized protein H6S33_011214 [Morchella sextelata]|jgi:hypothetical protein|uniref:uncharacterized protein n=1 Tax=Morchella sextelata TaxID=1174677 RepID=UPI001D04989A|nr:uncharacterized protein H6S33_011214 [Morchella sextelata]KAH0610787.1 hypothetical protein H6S33_011214 [Morchella sextelata]